MSRSGFTFIEVMTVVVLMAILFTIASLQFNAFIRKGAIEQQTKELYTDLMTVRTAAVTQHAQKRAILTPTSFTLISTSLAGGATSTRTIKSLAKPVTWTGRGSATQKEIVFDERGTFNIDVANGNTTICVEPSIEAAQCDSVVVFSTRIHLGKVGFEEECKSDNVTVR